MRITEAFENDWKFWRCFRMILLEEGEGKPLTDKKIAEKLTDYGFPTNKLRVFGIRRKYKIPASCKRVGENAIN